MVIFRRAWEPEGGTISGGENPVIPSSPGNREKGGAKAIINLTKVKKEIKSFREIMDNLI